MAIRFERVRAFLDYLQREEDEEVLRFDLDRISDVWRGRFVPEFREQLEDESGWIENVYAKAGKELPKTSKYLRWG